MARCTFLKQVPLLQPLSDHQISQVAACLKSEQFPAGTYIVRQFEHGETAKSILVKIADEQKYQRNDYFSVFIKDPKAGATFNPKTQGGEDHCCCH